MPFVREISKTVTLSALGAYTGYTTEDGNGEIAEMYVAISKACPAAGAVTITTTSTGKSILKVVDPSTLGVWYYPVQKAHGTTGNQIGTSAIPWRNRVPLMNERLRIKVASSSGLGAQTVTVKMRII